VPLPSVNSWTSSFGSSDLIISLSLRSLNTFATWLCILYLQRVSKEQSTSDYKYNLHVHLINCQFTIFSCNIVNLGVCVARKACPQLSASAYIISSRSLTNPLVDVLPGPCRCSLNLGSPWLANFLKDFERLANIAVKVLLAENKTNSGSIFDGLASALTLIRHHLLFLSVHET
jgi:hypothetical protein